MSRDQDVARSHYVKNDKSSFERAEQFQYLGTNLTNQNYIQEEIKSRLKSGKCLLSFDAKSYIFQSAIEKYKYCDIKNYDTACWFVWV
jgi:hypothetical protein